MLDRLNPYRKTAAAAVIAVIGWATAVVTSDPGQIVAAEWVGLATVLATALGVYATENKSQNEEV